MAEYLFSMVVRGAENGADVEGFVKAVKGLGNIRLGDNRFSWDVTVNEAKNLGIADDGVVISGHNGMALREMYFAGREDIPESAAVMPCLVNITCACRHFGVNVEYFSISPSERETEHAVITVSGEVLMNETTSLDTISAELRNRLVKYGTAAA